MVDVVVVGSIALDSVETPFGKTTSALGGSAVYAALAARFFGDVGIVGVVGTDFSAEHRKCLENSGIDIAGIETKEGNTFSWEGKYGFDVNVAETIKTDLGVLQQFEKPVIPEEYMGARSVFLANCSPTTQLAVLKQMKQRPGLVVSDTMNYYISRVPDAVRAVIRTADIALMNDAEARQLFATPNLLKAARKILELESRQAIIKKGEHGAIMLSENSFFSVPGYPLETVVDPTGCGDCFGGTLTGYLSQQKSTNNKTMRKAIVLASAVSSFNAEGFSVERVIALKKSSIDKRFEEFHSFVDF